ncbi:sugar transferase [Piscinibacter sp.]|uniref:sugar transferase n=1 Tax=Piscinibacter sp. TaxID=1903157 RepID=UPI002BDD5A1E|nr:sugar transferase [Albitalea sp.]HUG24370.1 sugar transferase [Albitalea sp.]
MGKRCFDLLLAAVALLLFSPLMLVIAVWVKLDSAGPVFFRQERVGRRGVPFRIHKFRTMVVDAPQSGPQITIGDDARITRAGRILRRHKLDELPQLLDVLRGAMSLVGPRPEVPRYVAMYPEPMRSKVLSVRPGITDPVSLQFFDESTVLGAAADPEREYVEVVMPRKLAAAAAYAEQATLANDLRTIAQTLRLLMKRWTS